MTVPRFGNLPETEIYTNPPLRDYLSNVQKRHRYLHLPGLRSRGDRASVPIELMFVPMQVSPSPISLDSELEDWTDQCGSVYAALERCRLLLLLSDPGMGKTTLIHRLARDLTFAPSRGPFIDRFGWMLPVPMMLRELELQSVDTFDGLLGAFLSHPVGEPLRDSTYLPRLLDEGRVLLMLDGIDELGDKCARLNLRTAVFEGMRRFPRCRWLLSSRVVDYAEVPFEHTTSVPGSSSGDSSTDRQLPRGAPVISKRYLAPFSNGRIKLFVDNWYALRDADAARKAGDLMAAIQRDKVLRRLARVPNTLALMALVHRVDATLPHQRSALYQRIIEAYLEPIHKHRIGNGAPDLPHERTLLARVGYEMQRRRRDGADGEVSASDHDVQTWIGQETVRTKAPTDVNSASEFLSSSALRGGLLVRTTDEHCTFSHLSFQEYLAAAALEGEVTGVRWAKEGESSLGINRTELRERAWWASWLETFCFLFEMVADRPEWHTELMRCVFGDQFAVIYEGRHGGEDYLFNLGLLAARLVVNPHSGLGPIERSQAVHACVYAQIRSSVFGRGDVSLLTMLMSCGLGDEVMESVCSQWPIITENMYWKVLDFRGAHAVDLELLAAFSTANVLNLSETRVQDITCIGRMKHLRRLNLGYTHVRDVSPIRNLRALEELSLEGTKIDDVAPLKGLPKLRDLWLDDTPLPPDELRALHLSLPDDCLISLGDTAMAPRSWSGNDASV